MVRGLQSGLTWTYAINLAIFLCSNGSIHRAVGKNRTEVRLGMMLGTFADFQLLGTKRKYKREGPDEQLSFH